MKTSILQVNRDLVGKIVRRGFSEAYAMVNEIGGKPVIDFYSSRNRLKPELMRVVEWGDWIEVGPNFVSPIDLKFEIPENKFWDRVKWFNEPLPQLPPRGY